MRKPKLHSPLGKPRAEPGRPSAAARLYDRDWQKARADHLRKNPLCVYCERQGVTKAAKVCDHIIPHRGDERLFWDRKNWQSLCKRCHDQKTARGE